MPLLLLLSLTLAPAFAGVGESGRCARALRALRIATGRATQRLSPESYRIFAQAQDGLPASEAQRAVLRANGDEALYDQFTQSSALFRRLNHYVALLGRSKPGPLRTLTLKQIAENGKDWWHAAALLRRYRAHAIYEKVMRNPDVALTRAETQSVASLFLAGDLAAFREYVRSGAVPSVVASAPTSLPLRRSWGREISVAAHGTGRIAAAIIGKIVRFGIPVPRVIATARRNAIYGKILENPDHVLTDGWFGEKAFAKKYNLEEDIARFREDVRVHGLAFARAAHARRLMERTVWGTLLSALAASPFLMQAIDRDDSFDEGLDDDRWERPGFEGMSRYDEKVELIFRSPAPHVSVRIGGMVYNYGMYEVQRFPVAQLRTGAGWGEFLSANHTRVELKLSRDEIDRLQDQLEVAVGSTYPWAMPMNNCVSETNRALRETLDIAVPSGANRSQLLTLSYFKVLKAMGSERVGAIRFASKGGTGKALDAAAATYEAAYFAGHLPGLVLSAELWDRLERATASPASSSKAP